MEQTLTEQEQQKKPKSKKKQASKKKDKISSEKKEEVKSEKKKDVPPLKAEDYDGWKSWYKSKIIKALEEGKEEDLIAFELGIQPQSIKNFLK